MGHLLSLDDLRAQPGQLRIRGGHAGAGSYRLADDAGALHRGAGALDGEQPDRDSRPTAGVPFPVFARATFGVFGANIPALLRGLVAIFWYGIQTYLASTAVIVLLLRLDPGLRSWTEPTFLGLHALGWAAFLSCGLCSC